VWSHGLCTWCAIRARVHKERNGDEDDSIGVGQVKEKGDRQVRVGCLCGGSMTDLEDVVTLGERSETRHQRVTRIQIATAATRVRSVAAPWERRQPWRHGVRHGGWGGNERHGAEVSHEARNLRRHRAARARRRLVGVFQLPACRGCRGARRAPSPRHNLLGPCAMAAAAVCVASRVCSTLAILSIPASGPCAAAAATSSCGGMG